jgi:Domain of unknown function (DUF5666)
LETARITERHGGNTIKEGKTKMTKILGALGAAMLCLGLLSSVSIMAQQEQTMPAKDPQKKEQKTKTTTLNGTVSAVTDSTVTIVDSQKAEHVLAVTSETKVMKGGKDATLADVKANDVVAVEARKGEGDTWTALKISVS